MDMSPVKNGTSSGAELLDSAAGSSAADIRPPRRRGDNGGGRGGLASTGSAASPVLAARLNCTWSGPFGPTGLLEESCAAYPLIRWRRAGCHLARRQVLYVHTPFPIASYRCTVGKALEAA